MSLPSEGAELSPQMAAQRAGLGPSLARVNDFVALMKPRVMSLVVFTALVGLLIAPVHLHAVLGFAALLSIAVGAGAAGALNMWYDADIDAVMARTAHRPIPAGRVSKDEALGFGITLAAGSILVLGLVSNWVAAGLLAFTIFFYAVIYTIWLKRSTPQNIVIGGVAGAFPPMIGWAAASGAIGLEAVFLFLIIFLWTPPHFWSLALCRTRDYERAGVPMLPVVTGTRETVRQIRLYSVALIPVGLAPWLIGSTGVLYGATAALAGVLMVALACRVRGGGSEAKALFRYSILYLFVLFATLLVDHALFGASAQMLAAR